MHQNMAVLYLKFPRFTKVLRTSFLTHLYTTQNNINILDSMSIQIEPMKYLHNILEWLVAGEGLIYNSILLLFLLFDCCCVNWTNFWTQIIIHFSNGKFFQSIDVRDRCKHSSFGTYQNHTDMDQRTHLLPSIERVCSQNVWVNW